MITKLSYRSRLKTRVIYKADTWRKACEESQAVCKAFRRLGHNAFSCDIITMDGAEHRIDGKWDMLIAFPPCTFLTNTGNRWFDVIRYGAAAQHRWNERCKAIVFFLRFIFADCDRIIVENPIGCMSTLFRKPDQVVHPYYFAESEDDENCERKATCLWTEGVPPLRYEIKFKPRVIAYKNGKGTDSPWHMKTMSLPAEERAKERSKTFPGFANALAEQYGGVCA